MVGTLSTTDPDLPNDAHTYTLVGGDVSAFSVTGNQLKTAASFDFETKSSYSITVRSTDQGGKWIEEAFTISVTNVNDAPTLGSIANPAAINEDAGLQTLNLTGISAGGGEPQTLQVTATSGNPG